MYKYIYICMRVYVYMYLCIYIYKCIYIFMYLCTYIYIQMYLCILCIHVFMYIRMYVYVYMYICKYVSMCACVYIYMYVCIYEYMNIWRYEGMNVCIYRYIYIYALSLWSDLLILSVFCGAKYTCVRCCWPSSLCFLGILFPELGGFLSFGFRSLMTLRDWHLGRGVGMGWGNNVHVYLHTDRMLRYDVFPWTFLELLTLLMLRSQLLLGTSSTLLMLRSQLLLETSSTLLMLRSQLLLRTYSTLLMLRSQLFLELLARSWCYALNFSWNF